MPSSPVLSDEDLVRQLAAGQHEAFGRLYRRYASRLFRVAARSLDRGTAEEIVQDVFMVVWRSAAVFTPERGTFRGWIQQIAHFRVLNELRRRRHRPQPQPDPDGVLLASLPGGGPAPEDSAMREALRPVIRSACEELPRPHRQAVELAFFKDLTHREAAAELGIPLGTFKMHVRTAIRELRDKLAPVV
jgi:RNA polymerase sigma-70 factor, ECF subfamily